MPYGLPKGLDTPANNTKMEHCVAERMKDPGFKPQAGRTKEESAIALCKASIMGTTERPEYNKEFYERAYKNKK